MNNQQLLGLGLILVAIIGGYIAVHEATHKAIFTEYGCQTGFGTSKNGIITYGNCPNLTREDSAGLNNAQANVEAIGYQLLIPTILLTLIALKNTKVNT